MSHWYYCRPLQSPFTVRRSPENIGSRRPTKDPDTITICNFQVKRRRATEPGLWRTVVDEVTSFLDEKTYLSGGKVYRFRKDVNLFANRLQQSVADRANVAVLVDSVINPPPITLIGAALKYEYPRLQLVGVSHDEGHHREAEILIQSAYLLLGTTFNREVG